MWTVVLLQILGKDLINLETPKRKVIQLADILHHGDTHKKVVGYLVASFHHKDSILIFRPKWRESGSQLVLYHSHDQLFKPHPQPLNQSIVFFWFVLSDINLRLFDCVYSTMNIPHRWSRVWMSDPRKHRDLFLEHVNCAVTGVIQLADIPHQGLREREWVTQGSIRTCF